MRNSEIADVFTELADRLALTDLKPYRYMAYRTAATRFRELGESVALLSSEGRLLEVDGVGPAIEEKVRSLLETGSFPALDRAREEVPDALLGLTKIPGIGGATARKIHAALDGESVDAAIERAALGTLPTGNGITPKVVGLLAAEAERRASGVASSGADEGVPRDADGAPLPGPWFRRDQALAQIAAIVELLPPGVIEDPQPSGAYARGCELVRGVRVVASAAEGHDAAGAVEQLRDALGARGYELEAADLASLVGELDDPGAAAALAAVSPAGVPLEVVVAAPAARAVVSHRAAGPAAWIVREPEPAVGSVPIELRERVLTGELDAETAPRDLLTEADFRGDLHTHSDWSDGKAKILDMARAARDRGDRYICVTDHSAPYAMVGGLDDARLQAQAEEIAAANEQLAAEHEGFLADLPAALDPERVGDQPFRVLHGTELEILADGSLGLADAMLERLDWVVASIHVSQRQGEEVIVERMRRAVVSPFVDAIGHPTSRRVLTRSRTALPIDVLVELAVEHGLVLEINANPDRLDLDSDHAARALAGGVRLTVNTDAHRTRTLGLRSHGVSVARRAGARAVDVVNCLDAETLLAGRRRHR